jgi:Domain of unknown function (DUF5060)
VMRPSCASTRATFWDFPESGVGSSCSRRGDGYALRPLLPLRTLDAASYEGLETASMLGVRWPLPLVISCCVAALLLMAACTSHQVPDPLFAEVSQSADAIPRYGLVEISFTHNGLYPNRFLDVQLEASFLAPSGLQQRVKGFFYGGDVWKVRFSPDEPGHWTYRYVMISRGGFHQRGEGGFDCTPSDAAGPVRQHPEHPYRWVFATGTPYFPVGLQDCIGVQEGQLAPMAIDGEGRDDSTARRLSLNEYFAIYGQAGFNLFRFSQQNCSYSLLDDLDAYREVESHATDELLRLARKHGFRVMFGFFGSYRTRTLQGGYLHTVKWIVQKMSARIFGIPTEIGLDSVDPELITQEKRFIEYAVARWGVYVDFWELLNERDASDEWTAMMADYVRSVDPDRKPISTSWEKPSLPAIDINAPHWYESESELESDLRVQEMAAAWKQAGKPIVVGEHGNTGMNWDPLSGQRMRIRTWTALFQEISVIFWNTSWSKLGMHEGWYAPGHVANIYLGPEERGYIRVLRDFASRLDAGAGMTPVKVSPSHRIRGYALRSSRGAAAYFHHFENHTVAVQDAKITLDLPGPAPAPRHLIGAWIDPSSGDVLAHVQVPPGLQTLDVPPFTIDLALWVTSEPGRLPPARHAPIAHPTSWRLE